MQSLAVDGLTGSRLEDLSTLSTQTSTVADGTRYRKTATILSSNLDIKQWGNALGNPILTASLVDRLMEKGHIINIKRGRSYRTHGPDAPPEDQRPAGLPGDRSEP